MPACENFLGWTYVHWLMAGIVSASTAAVDPLQRLNIDAKQWWVILTLVVAQLAITYAIVTMPLGPFKYVLFLFLSVITGSLLSGVFDLVEKKGVLLDVLITNVVIFITMSAVGFYDNGNSVGFGGYLFAALVGLIVGRIGLYIARSSSSASEMLGELKTVDLLLSVFTTGLFALYVAYDTSMLKRMARACAAGKEKPDYINGAMGLYIDLMNLFVSTSSLLADD